MANFHEYVPLLLQAEGGYQAIRSDRGNYNSRNELVGTNFGISAPVYEIWIGRPPTVEDMKALTKETALNIYRRNYWDAIGASEIENQSVANIIVDHAVNAGVTGAGRLVQRVLNNEFGFNLDVDGAIGPKTRFAINGVFPNQLHEAVKKARETFYKNVPFPVADDFLRGWLIRLEKFVFEEKKKCCSECGRPL